MDKILFSAFLCVMLAFCQPEYVNEQDMNSIQQEEISSANVKNANSKYVYCNDKYFYNISYYDAATIVIRDLAGKTVSKSSIKRIQKKETKDSTLWNGRVCYVNNKEIFVVTGYDIEFLWCIPLDKKGIPMVKNAKRVNENMEETSIDSIEGVYANDGKRSTTRCLVK